MIEQGTVAVRRLVQRGDHRRRIGPGEGQPSGIVAAPHTPMWNLLLGMLDKLGVQQASFADSNGKIEI